MSHLLTFKEWLDSTLKEVKLPRRYSVKVEINEDGDLYYTISNRRMLTDTGKEVLKNHLKRVIKSLDDESNTEHDGK